MATRYCEKCGKQKDEKNFYTTKRLDKYPDGRLNMCKDCMTMHVDNWDKSTFLWILEEVDVPFRENKWNDLLEKHVQGGKKITGATIIGKYLSMMKIKQYKDDHFEDTERLAEEARQERIQSMKAQGYSGEEIEEELKTDRTPMKPKEMAKQAEAEVPQFYDPEQEEDEFSDQLTEDDKKMLRLKWGRGYRAEEWIQLEQLYNDFKDSYDIYTAGHKDTLKKVCKASLRADQLMDAGDIDGAQKMIRVYNDLMKSGNFQGVQNKEAQGEGIDSIGEIVRICEQQGFIPRYYTDGPQDKVDQTLLDLQHYTRNLVIEELNLGNMIESALISIQKDKEQEAKIVIEDGDDEDDQESAALFQYREDNPVTDDEFIEFAEDEESQAEEDERYIRDVVEGRQK